MTKYERTIQIIKERREQYKQLSRNSHDERYRMKWWQDYIAIDLLLDEIIERLENEAQ